MKRSVFIFIIIAVAFMASCKPPFGINTMHYTVHNEELSVIWPKMDTFAYQDDPTGYWKSPAEFEADGGGDCEDFVTYMMYYLGPESSMCVIKFTNSIYLHAIVKYHERYLEAEHSNSYWIVSPDMIYQEFTWDEVMYRSTLRGTKNLK